MSKSILITGGAASGKSRWAVTNYSRYDYVLYLRTGEAVDRISCTVSNTATIRTA